MSVDFGIRGEFRGNIRAYVFVLELIEVCEARGFRREWAFIF